MTLGLVVHFFDFRNDVRALLAELALRHRVVLLVRPQDQAALAGLAPAGMEIRLIDERRRTPLNRVWDKLYAAFGRLPKSRQNFYLMETFKISLQPDAGLRARAMRRLHWRMRLPAWLSYDGYLDRLSYAGKTDLSGLDQIICFTDIADDYLMARLVQTGQAPTVYVYSWDHPCKHVRYSARCRYLVWNDGLAEDVATLQRVPRRQVRVLGASQFGYVERYATSPSPPNPPLPHHAERERGAKLTSDLSAELARKARVAGWGGEGGAPFIYFGCAIGLPGLMEQEVAVVVALARALAEAAPGMMMRVRPYPVLKDWAVYAPLHAEPNVYVEEDFRVGGGSLAVAEAAIAAKFATLRAATGFLHLGTTLGLEACFTDTPSFLVDFDAFKADKDAPGLPMYHFVHQYQNDKYLYNRPAANVIRSPQHFADVVQAGNWEQYIGYNRAVRADFPVKSFAELAEELEFTIL